jgi:hypothetical protein
MNLVPNAFWYMVDTTPTYGPVQLYDSQFQKPLLDFLTQKLMDGNPAAFSIKLTIPLLFKPS